MDLGTRGEEVTVLPTWISVSIISFFVKKLNNYCPKFVIGREQAWSLLEPLCKWPTAAGFMNSLKTKKKKPFSPSLIYYFCFSKPNWLELVMSFSFSECFKTPFTVRLLRPVNNMNHHPDRPWGPPTLLYNGYCIFPGGKAAGTWLSPPNPT